MIGALLRVAWPLALGGLVTTLVAGNDTVLLGRLGAEAVAIGAVAVGVLLVATVALNGFAVPAQILAARSRGAGDMGAAARSAERAGSVALWISLPLTALLEAAAEPIVTLLAGTAVPIGPTATYLRIVVLGLPLLTIGAVVRGYAVGIGRSRVVLMATVATAVVDVGASLALITAGSGPVGVAAGTLLGSCAPAAVGLIWLRTLDTDRPSVRAMLRLPGGAHSEAWTLGWPEAVTMASGTASQLVVTVLLAPAGAVAIATVRTLDVAIGVVWTVLAALGTAGTTLMAERIGAADGTALRKVVRTVAAATGSVALLAATVLPLATPLLLQSAIADPRISDTAGPVAWIAWAQVLWMAGTATTNGLLRAHGDTNTPMRASLLGEYLIFLPVGWLLCRVLRLDVPGIFLAHHVFWAAFLTTVVVRARRHLRHPTHT